MSKTKKNLSSTLGKMHESVTKSQHFMLCFHYVHPLRMIEVLNISCNVAGMWSNDGLTWYRLRICEEYIRLIFQKNLRILRLEEIFTILRDHPRFTGYPCRVLGIFPVKKNYPPPYFTGQKKLLPPLFQPQKKAWPPHFRLKKKYLPPFFDPTKKVQPPFSTPQKSHCPPLFTCKKSFGSPLPLFALTKK